MMPGKVFATLILVMVCLTAWLILNYIWFQYWLRNLSEHFKLPGWLERLRRDLHFDWRIMILSGALTSFFWVSVSLLLLIWELLPWNLAPLFIGASLATGLVSILNYAFRLRFRW
jgi:hypothetical protein